MKLANRSLDQLLNEKLTFLVGAGCSIGPPSCLPAGHKMMEVIVKYTCPELEIEKILELEELRFEALVEILRDNLDPELKIINFYGLCDKPNIQHFFLVEMIKKGHFVMTTNFDFLIEYALLQSGVPKKKVIPVITKNDFQKFDDPEELSKNGKMPVYKIHGSTKNIIAGEDTTDSLIATIQAFGSNKQGENVFQLESFKQPAFVNATKGRSLVVMGYSGSDDFDIVPTLKVLREIRNIIWIDFVENDNGKELIYEIDASINQSEVNKDKVNQILADIQRTNHACQVFRVDTNTTRLINNLINIKPELSPSNFDVDVMEWLKANITTPHEIKKYYISYNIYNSLDLLNDALRCLEEILHMAEDLGARIDKANCLNNIGLIYRTQGKHKEAIKLYKQAIIIVEQLGDLKTKAKFLLNMGETYRIQGNYDEALNRFQEALPIFDQFGKLLEKAKCLNNIGLIYQDQRNYPKALEMYETALKISEQLGSLKDRAIFITNIGAIYKDQGNYFDALKRYETAIKLYEQLGNLSEKSACLNNSGEIYRAQRNYVDAMKSFEDALQISEQLGDVLTKATCLNNIGLTYDDQGKSDIALELFQEVVRLAEQLGNIFIKAKAYGNIALIYMKQGNYRKALNLYEEALQIYEQLDDNARKINSLAGITMIYYAQQKYDDALRTLKKLIKIIELMGDLREIPSYLTMMGTIYKQKGSYPQSLECYERALKINEQLGDLLSNTTVLDYFAEIYLLQGNYAKAIETLEEALKIFSQLGMSETPAAKTFEAAIKNFKNMYK